jgi:hypothetical protein
MGAMLTKLVNEKHNDWDEHLGIILYVYCTTFKVSTSHAPFQMFFSFHPIMPMEYFIPIVT